MALAALEGAEAAGAETEIAHLRGLDIGACLACKEGWGICRTEHSCIIADDFHSIREQIGQADAVVISTPVYFGEPSEVTKSFFDRLRRCEFPLGEESLIYGTPAIVISAAGGSGGGAVTALEDMERYLRVISIRPFDLITVTRFTREHKIETAKAAGAALVEFAKNGG
jgi:multimeric flavodoxin WrbA